MERHTITPLRHPGFNPGSTNRAPDFCLITFAIGAIARGLRIKPAMTPKLSGAPGRDCPDKSMFPRTD